MRLYVGPTSPFARLTTVVAKELKIEALSVETINVYQAEFLDALNPLRQIPTLVLDDGQALYDSRVICRYFDQLSDEASIWPDDDHALMTRMSLALGIMETGLARVMELKKGERCCQDTVTKLETRIYRAIRHLNADAEFFKARPLAIDQLTVACALEYTDFRFNEHWREEAPDLGRWLVDMSLRQSMLSTQPADP